MKAQNHSLLKRLMLLVCLLASGMSVEAQSYVSALESGKTYWILNVKTGTALYDDASGSPKQTGVGLTDQFKWVVTTHADGGYTVKNVQTGSYLTPVSINDETAKMSASEQICYIPNISGEQFAIVNAEGATVSLNIHGTYGTIVGWRYNNDNGSYDNGSLWRFAEIEVDENVNIADYCYPTGTISERSNGNDRYINSLSVTDGTNAQSVAGISKASDRSMYQNLSPQVLTFTAGSTLTLNVDWVGKSMHGYVYMDYNQDGAFSYDLDTDGTPADGSELVSFTYYNGKNSLGETTEISDALGNIPSFQLPSDLAAGYYRIRFKIDWDYIDPCGRDSDDSNSNASNGGDVIDFTLKVENLEPEKPTLADILAENNGLVRLSVVVSSNRGENTFLATEDADVMKGRAEAGTNNQIWLIEALADDGYTIRNMSSGKYVAAPVTANAVSLSESPSALYITESAVEGVTDKFVISSSATFNDGSCFYFDGQLAEVVGGNKETAAAAWEIAAATDADLIRYYKVRNKNYTEHYLTESWVERNMTGAADNGASTQIWKFINIGGKYNIQSVSSKDYVQADPGQSSRFLLGATPVYFELAEADGTYGIYHEDGAGRGLHENGSQRIVSWNYTAAASRWYLEGVELTAEQIAVIEADYHNEYGQWGSTETSKRFLSFFNDAIATELKSEYQTMSDADLRRAMSGIGTELQDVAIKVKNNTWATWEKGFRVAEYGAFSNATYWAEQLNTFNYGSINNPTGIVANNGDKVLIIVGDDIPADATLHVETRCLENVADCSNSDISPQKLQLKKGVNCLPCTTDGSHFYISYISKNGDLIANYPELDIHVAGGQLQGYMDIKKHTDEDWVSMRTAGLFTAARTLDLLGNYAQLHISTSAATQNGNEILPLIEIYDWYVHTELDLMGITAAPAELKDLPGADAYEDIYPKKVNNRMLCIGINNGKLHGGPGHICIDGDGNFNYKNLQDRGESAWGAAHEYGHVNQGSILLLGSREVSNNLYSNVVLHKGGTCTSRGWSLNDLQTYMQKGVHNWPHIVTAQYWCAPHMFYQLYLYYHAAGKDPFFYQKLFKLLRANPLNPPTGDGGCSGTQDYLKFALLACEAAQEDLTSFFEYWGFFEPVSNFGMSDYATHKNWVLTTTQEEIDGVKADMAKYSKKCNAAMIFIDDRAVESFCADGTVKVSFDKNYTVENNAIQLAAAQYSAYNEEVSRPSKLAYTIDANGTVSLESNASGASGFIFYNASGKLVYAAAQNEFTIPSELLSSIDHGKTVAALPDGTTLPFYNLAETGVFAQTIYHADGTQTTRYTKGSDNAIFSAERDGANAIATVEGENVPTMLSSLDNVSVNGTMNKLVLTDNADFDGGDNTFSAKTISYTDRKLYAGWNSVCLPFAVSAEDFGTDSKIEVLKEYNADNETLVFEEVASVAAGQPFLLWMEADTEEGWTLTKNGDTGLAFVGRPAITAENFYMNGSFTTQTIGAGHYKLNNAGTAFGVTSDAGMTYPFRAYVSTTQATAAPRLSVEHGGTPTGIDAMGNGQLIIDNCLYDLQGRKVTKPRRGEIYILGGRKVIFK